MSSDPLISVCVPARNEEAFIGRCLESVRKAEAALGSPVEIIVALNRCTDRTEEIARSYGAIITNEDAKNLARIRNAAARLARGRILVTIDADGRMSENLLVDVKRKLERGRTVGGGTRIRPERWSLGIFLTAVVIGGALLAKGVGAGLFWCWKDDFEAIGGFDESMLTGEDVRFAERLKSHGRLTGRRFENLWKESILTSTRKFDRFGDWYYLNPFRLWAFYRSSDPREANRHWYDVER